VLVVSVMAWNDRHIVGLHGPACLDLGTHETDGPRRRSDEYQAGVDAGVCEVGVLGQEAVAGVDRVHMKPASSFQNRVDVQVRFDTGGRPNANGLVCQNHVPCLAICFGIDCDRLDPHLVTGPHDPNRDLPAIRHQDTLEVRHKTPPRPAGSQGPVTSGCLEALPVTPSGPGTGVTPVPTGCAPGRIEKASV